MGELDKYEPWSFEGIALAVESASVQLTTRRHDHVYPHTAGAAGEKMGRNLYEIDVHGIFSSRLTGRRYSDSLNQMGAFRWFVEQERTGDLVIPWIGTIQAQCKSLKLDENNRNRSDLKFSASFVEDMNYEFPIQNFIKVSRANMGTWATTLTSLKPKKDIFSLIAEAVGFLVGIKDTLDLYTALVISKIEYLEKLFREADETASELDDPQNSVLLEAFMQLWQSVRTFGEDIQSKGLSFRYYVTPQDMTLQEVALKIFRDVSRAGDLLGLNVIEDTLNIRAGTKIRYYEQSV